MCDWMCVVGIGNKRDDATDTASRSSEGRSGFVSGVGVYSAEMLCGLLIHARGRMVVLQADLVLLKLDHVGVLLPVNLLAKRQSKSASRSYFAPSHPHCQAFMLIETIEDYRAPSLAARKGRHQHRTYHSLRPPP